MCDKCRWKELVTEIEEGLGNPYAEFAEDTLTGIRDWVTEHAHCTDKQRRAIHNILAAADRRAQKERDRKADEFIERHDEEVPW